MRQRSENILLVHRKKGINFHRPEINLKTAFSTEMKETENNGTASLECWKETTVYLELYKIVKLSFTNEDAVKYFLT